MTNIDDNIVLRRVLVDWDGDSFYNEGVLQSTPPNLFPSQLYTSGSYLKGFDGSFVNSYYEDISDHSPRGLVKRRIPLGTNATTLRLMWDDYEPYQPHAGDPANAIVGAANIEPTLGEWSTNLNLSEFRFAAAPPKFDNGKLGQEVARIAANGNAPRGIIGTNYTNSTFPHNYASPTYHDGLNRYSGAVSGTTTGAVWAGMPTIVPGQSYTFVAYLGMYKEDISVGLTATFRARLYANGGSASTPNFGRQWLGSVDGSLTPDGWVAVHIQFTAPAGATTIAFDLQTAFSGTVMSAAYIGGMMLLPGTVSLPTRFWDNGVTYRDSQFSYVFPDDNQPYVVTFFVRSPNGITLLNPTMHEAVLGTNTISNTSIAVIPITTDWKRVNVVVGGQSSRRGVWFTFTAQKSGVPVDPSNAGDVEFSGFQITQGSVTTYPYHAGTLYGYDDITEFVLDVSTKSGRSEFEAPLPDEGSASIKLNNDDQRFSPNNAASPLYGYHDQNLKVKIQLWDNLNEVWIDLWSGWTETFEIEPGLYSSQQATLECQQGMYRLAEGTLSVPMLENTSMDVLARNIIESSGWRSTYSALQSFVGLRTLVGQNAYTQDTDLMYRTVEDGVNTIEISGRDWSQDTDPRRALEDALEAENAAMWINRDGTISIVNRNHWITTDVDDTFSLDRTVNAAEYTYGQDLINGVEVSVTKNKAVDNATVWKTKRPIRVRPQQVWVVDLNPTYTEGKFKTVIEYTLEGMSKDVYLKDIGIDGDTTGATTDQPQKDAVRVELLGNAGERPQIRVKNNNSIDMWVQLEVKGKYLETGDSIIVKMENAASVDKVQGKHIETYSNPLITDERQAESYGEYLMLRRSEPHGAFNSFKVVVRNQEDLDRVLALQVGSIVKLSEAQSGEEGVNHAIIGEEFEITNSRTLDVTYHTARTLQENFAKADISVAADATVNMIPDIYIGATTNGGSFVVDDGKEFGLEKIMYWQTDRTHDNKLVLAPSRDQLVVYETISELQYYPKTDAGGIAFNPRPVLDFYRPPYRLTNDYFGMWETVKKQEYVAWYISDLVSAQPTTNGTIIQYFYGARKNKDTDDSLGGITPAYELALPLLADAKYIARSELLTNGTGANSTPQHRLRAMSNTGGSLSQWASLTAAVSNSALPGKNNANHYLEHTFRARKATSGDLVGVTGFQLLEITYAGSVFVRPAALKNLHLLRYSDYGKVGGTFLDTSIGHKYTLFARTDYDDVATGYTLTVIAEDGSTIGTATATLSKTAITKMEVNIPAGNKSAWAFLKKTTNDYRDTKIYIYSYGITPSSVSVYTDLLVEQTQELVYA